MFLFSKYDSIKILKRFINQGLQIVTLERSKDYGLVYIKIFFAVYLCWRKLELIAKNKLIQNFKMLFLKRMTASRIE